MATTRYFLDTRAKAQDGKGSIVLLISHNHTTTTMRTGIRISKDNWNKNKVVKLPEAELFNFKLQEQKTSVDKAIAFLSVTEHYNNMTASDIKKAIENNCIYTSAGHSLIQLFNEYMNTGNLKDGTLKIYKSTIGKIEKYAGTQFKIESLDLKWLRGFDRFLSETQGVNGRSIYLRCLRAVCNYAKHNGIQCQYPFDNFQIKHEETRKRCISVEDLRAFYTCKTTKQNEIYRDYFFLMFFLIGINSKDLLLAKKTQIVNDRLEYIREKTGKRYSIKIEPEAQMLLNKYAGKAKFLLEAMDRCKHYESFLHEINDGIKNIGREEITVIYSEDDLFAEPRYQKKIQPIIPHISTYYARHTWATFAHQLGISSDIIALALGHSNINKTTFIYIKPDISKVDEANRKVIDYFLNK